MRKITISTTLGLLLLSVAVTESVAQADILSLYRQQSGRNPTASDIPPASQSGSDVETDGAPQSDVVPPSPLFDGTEMTPDRIEGFNDAVQQVFPMTPEMITRYREIFEASQRAIMERPEPEGRVTTGLVSLDPGEAAPLINVAPSIASVVGFYDASGAPWRISQYVVGDSEDFQVVRLGEESNNLTISPSQRLGHTNIVVLLEGLDRPVTFRVRISEEVAHYRHDIQVMELGPEANRNTAYADPTMTVEEAGSSYLLAALSGVDLPAEAVPVTIEGVSARGWVVGDALYLRSRAALLSPSWSESMSGPDGIRVYRIELASVALFSVDGQIVRADINLP